MTAISQNLGPVRPFMGKPSLGPGGRQPTVIVPPKMTELKDIPMKTFQEFEVQYGQDVDRICEDHESLIKVILEEEEELIQSHRQHIDEVVEIARQDMNLLHEVDQPQSDIDKYVGKLDRILLDKMDMIGKLRQKLVTFYTHLRQEENLQKLY